MMGFFVTVYSHIDVVMVRFFANEVVVGWYAAALQIFRTVEFIPLVLTTALLPTVARLHARDTAAMASIARNSIVLGALLMVPAAIGMTLIADWVIALLPYPDGFANSIPLIMLLGLATPITALLTILGTIAVAADRQKAWASALGFTLLLNVLLNALFISYFQNSTGNGAIGAVVATIISEALMVIVGIHLMSRDVIGPAVGAKLLSIAVASAGMLGLGLLLKLVGLPALAAAGIAGITYVGMVVSLKAITLGDIWFVVAAVRKKAAL